MLASGIGCGITAYDLADALQLVAEGVFGGGSLPELASVVEDVDVSSLDPNHVLPNMRSPLQRGVWFPMT
jgi:hypothetical protein